MASVTVPGTNGSTITHTYGNQFNQILAQQISNALAADINHRWGIMVRPFESSTRWQSVSSELPAPRPVEP